MSEAGRHRPSRGVQAAVLAVLLATAAPAASAGTVVSAGSSDAYSLNLDATAAVFGTQVLKVMLGPLNEVSGIAPPPYSNSSGVEISISGGVLNASSGALSTSASSDVTGTSATATTAAATSLANLSIVAAYVAGPFNVPLFSIVGSAVASSSTVTGGYGSLIATGTASVAELSVSVLGGTPYTISGDIAPNTTFTFTTPIGTATLVLNEQTTGGDGISSANITTNFLDLTLTNAGIANVASVDASIVVGHTFAEQTAVPEAPGLAMLGTGLTLLGAWSVAARRLRGPSTAPLAL